MRTLMAIRISGICLYIACMFFVPFTHFIMHKTSLDSFIGRFGLAALFFALMASVAHSQIRTLRARMTNHLPPQSATSHHFVK
jgi:hypothetical protein